MVTEMHLRDFEVLWGATQRCWLSPDQKDRITFVSYADIDPTTRETEGICKTLQWILDGLGLDDRLGTDIIEYLDQARSYRRTSHPELRFESTARAQKALEGYCRAFGYEAELAGLLSAGVA